jgi:flagellar basal-body rod modification protein FlgD
METITQTSATAVTNPPPASQTTHTTASRTASATTATGQSTASTTQPVISSDFETFLKMLTVQMENQDPLNPIESTEFATQLATFSSVEQQVQTNDLLKAMGSQIGAMSVSQLSSWVGMTAHADMPAQFEGNPIRIVTDASNLANSAQLVVRNSVGAEVARQDIPTTRTETDWTGANSSGGRLPIGAYSLEVESFSNGELIQTSPVLVEARIIEARNENGQPLLIMNTGQAVASSDIVGLRESKTTP